MTRVGSDLKQKIIDSVKSTWRTINDFTQYRRGAGIEPAVETYTDSIAEIDAQSSDSMSMLTIESVLITSNLFEKMIVAKVCIAFLY